MATCLHGFETGQCLICQTLGSGRTGSGRLRPVSSAERRAGGATSSTPSGGPVEVVETDRGRAGPGATGRIMIAVVMIVVAIIAFWLVAGVVVALLRLLEIVFVAAVAGVLGYRLGRARGHRER